MNHGTVWLTVSQVNACQTLEKVKLSDDIAICNPEDSDWVTGIVTKIDTYKDRSTRWIEKRVITVQPHDGSHSRAFYEMHVDTVLFASNN